MAQDIKSTETGATPVQRYIDPFSAMRAEMDRVFDSFLGRGFTGFPRLQELSKATRRSEHRCARDGDRARRRGRVAGGG